MTNLPLFLARRIHHGEQADPSGRRRQISRPAIRIATIGVAIGIAVMLLALSVTAGFKNEVKERISGLGCHIQITNLQAISEFQSTPIHYSDTLLGQLQGLPGIGHVQRYSLCSGVLMNDAAFQGIQLKGIGQDYDTAFFARCLEEGHFPPFSDSVSSNQILISRTIAHKLQLKVGDRIAAYFLGGNQQMRARKFQIAGIFQTHFSSIDEQLVLTDLRTANRLNGWDNGQTSGLEITLLPGTPLDMQTELLRALYDRQEDGQGGLFRVQNIEELNPGIFAWLSLLDTNVWVILILMTGIASFTMICGLLILILERTATIGLLKALGCPNRTLRATFLYLALYLVGRGMLFGNAAALLLYFIQKKWAPFRLDPETYYTNHVPVLLDFPTFLSLNVGAMVIAVLMLLTPSHLVSRISPARAIRYE